VKLPRRAHRVRVPGFRFAGVRAGFKGRGPDVALVVSDPPAVTAGVLTRNHAPAAPVQLTRERLRGGRAGAVLVNAGNANAGTGLTGLSRARAATALAADLLGLPAGQVLACSTGRIGVQVPSRALEQGVRAAVAALAPDGFPDAAQAILTTDVFPKTVVRRLVLDGRRVTLAILGKGAGMIAPDLATMLVFAVTDAALPVTEARRVLRAATGASLNEISVDGDMSTNDTVLLMANGRAGNRPLRAGTVAARRFERGLTEALEEMGRLIVLDGEGSTKLVEVLVRGAPSQTAARRVARAVATSTLCKCAFHGADPNWGRFVCAAGTASVPLDAERIDVSIGGIRVSRRGEPVPAALRRAASRMRRREFTVELHLHAGKGTARMLTCDLSTDYVRFNAEYTT
jgi:glutamate N-acetyltransferase / amino-acid N-acetyltransferase